MTCRYFDQDQTGIVTQTALTIQENAVDNLRVGLKEIPIDIAVQTQCRNLFVLTAHECRDSFVNPE